MVTPPLLRSALAAAFLTAIGLVPRSAWTLSLQFPPPADFSLVHLGGTRPVVVVTAFGRHPSPQASSLLSAEMSFVEFVFAPTHGTDEVQGEVVLQTALQVVVRPTRELKPGQDYLMFVRRRPLPGHTWRLVEPAEEEEHQDAFYHLRGGGGRPGCRQEGSDLPDDPFEKPRCRFEVTLMAWNVPPPPSVALRTVPARTGRAAGLQLAHSAAEVADA